LRETRCGALAAALRRADHDPIVALPAVDRRAACARAVDDELVARRQLIEQGRKLAARDIRSRQIESIFLAVVAAVTDEHDQDLVVAFRARSQSAQFLAHVVALSAFSQQHRDARFVSSEFLRRFGKRLRLIAKALLVLLFAAESRDDERVRGRECGRSDQ
jgi:hypothetical protein